jgi:hypothetical protein
MIRIAIISLILGLVSFTASAQKYVPIVMNQASTVVDSNGCPHKDSYCPEGASQFVPNDSGAYDAYTDYDYEYEVQDCGKAKDKTDCLQKQVSRLQQQLAYANGRLMASERDLQNAKSAAAAFSIIAGNLASATANFGAAFKEVSSQQPAVYQARQQRSVRQK